MRIPIFMIFQFFGIISAWAARALEDGKITAAEGLELIVSLATVLGVRAEFDISDYMPPAVEVEPVDDGLPGKNLSSSGVVVSGRPVRTI